MVRITAVLLLFSMLYYRSGYPQNSPTHHAEVLGSYLYIEETDLSLQWSFRFDRHSVQTGPMFPIFGNHSTILGWNVLYRFYPNKIRPAFDLFFQYQAIPVRRKLFSQSTEKGFSLHQLLGYGFGIRLCKGLYFVHSIMAGLEKGWFKGYRSLTDPSILLSAGIGFDITEHHE
ncbi:MAG: hypothetical protein JW861_04175 [Bacteroidales bacterium]|nr:hypothetical protein [Bacteroidales bacterium]